MLAVLATLMWGKEM